MSFVVTFSYHITLFLVYLQKAFVVVDPHDDRKVEVGGDVARVLQQHVVHHRKEAGLLNELNKLSI